MPTGHRIDNARLSRNVLRGYRPKNHEFRRQYPVDCYTADFTRISANLIAELDGAIYEVTVE